MSTRKFTQVAIRQSKDIVLILKCPRCGNHFEHNADRLTFKCPECHLIAPLDTEEDN